MPSDDERGVLHIVPDASLVAKWHFPDQEGWATADAYRHPIMAGLLRLTAPDQLKVEVIRVLQLGVRNRHYTADEGVHQVGKFLALPIRYVSNDVLFLEAFGLATDYQMALYDALYVALAEALPVPFVTADQRLANLGRQRGVASILWYAELARLGLQSDA